MPPEDSQIENLPSGDGSGDKPDDEDLYNLGGWRNESLKKNLKFSKIMKDCSDFGRFIMLLFVQLRTTNSKKTRFNIFYKLVSVV